MNVKSMMLGSVLALTMTTVNAADITRVIVRQQWPWSTDVKVEYELTNVTEPVDLGIRLFNGDVELDASGLEAKKAISGERYAIRQACVGTLVIDPVKLFGGEKVAFGDFRVELTAKPADPKMTEALYRIYDLTSIPCPCEEVSRLDIMNHPEKYGDYETDFSRIGPGFQTTLEDVFIWTGVTNNPEYKTSKLVMRKIPAASLNRVWRCGSIGGDAYSASFGSRVEPAKYVRMTNDFYIGVFEITQNQCYRINSFNNPSEASEKGQPDSDYRPLQNMPYYTVVGNQSNQNGMRYATWKVDWPNSGYWYEAGNNTFMHRLQNRAQVEFYLPTEAQWEIACRAGTETPYNSGKAGLLIENADEMGWVEGYGHTHTQPVGGKKPNAFGLYDMHGNVAEYVVSNDLCGDQPNHGDSADDPVIEPTGTAFPAAQGPRRKCGGSYGDHFGSWKESTSYANTDWFSWSNADSQLGFRVVCPVTKLWNGIDTWPFQ